MIFFPRSRRTTWITWLSIFCGLFIAVILRHSIISTAGEIVLSKFVFKRGKVHFSYASGQWKWGKIRFSKVVITKEGMHAEIDEVTLKYHIHVYPLTIDHELSLTDPKIQIERKDGSETHSYGLYHLIAHRLLKHPLVIERGCVQLSGDRDPPLIPFSCYVTALKTAHATVGNEEIHIELSLKQEEILAKIHLNQLSLPWIASLYTFMHWTFDDGYLGGDIDLCLLKSNEIKNLHYALEVDKLSCRNSKWAVALKAEEFKLKEHFLSLKDYNAQCKRMLFRQIWPCFLGDGTLRGGEVTFAHWKLSDVEGNLNFDVQNHPIIDLKGKWLEKDKSYQFDFFGKGTVVNQWAWKVECDYQMGQQHMPNMRTYLSLMSPGPHNYVLQADISNFNVDQILLSQGLFALKFPDVCHLSITDGLVTGKIHAFRKDGSWQRITLKDIVANQVKWSWKESLLSGTLDTLQGSIGVDLDRQHWLEESDWDIVIQNADIHSGLVSQFTGLNLNLSMHNKYIRDSRFEWEFGDISGHVGFDGSFSNLALKMHMDAKTKSLFTLLGGEYIPDSLLSEKQDMDLTALISQIGPRWLIDGELAVHHSSIKTDSLTFGCRIEEKTFLEERFSLEGLQKAFVSGWFQARDLSAPSCNLPLKLMSKDWEIDGTIDLDGRFDDKQLEFILHPHAATFKSRYFNAVVDDGDFFSKQNYKTFHYDFQTDDWKATIPLRNVWFQDNLVGLEFDELNAMVLIDGMQIRMEKVEACSKGVYFEGGLTLDCVSDNEVNLDLKTNSIRGTAENVQTFFRQFGAFSHFNLPLSGHISSGDQGLKLKVNLEGNLLPDWQLLVSLDEGCYEITSDVKLDHLTFDLSWDSRGNYINLTDMLGTLLLSGSDKVQDYRFNTKYLKFSPQSPWEFDISIERPTYDVLRCIGSVSKEVNDGGMNIIFNEGQLRFFGSKLDIQACQFDRRWNLESMQFKTSIQSYDLVNYIAFLNQCGVIPFKTSILEDLRTAMVEGVVALSCLYDDQGREIILEAQSDYLLISEIPINQFHLHAVRHGSVWELKDFHANTLNATASIEKHNDIWSLSHLDIDLHHSFLKGSSGTYDKEIEKFDLILDEVAIDLEEWQPFLNQIVEKDGYLQGLVKLDGSLSIDCTKGIKNWKITSDLNFSSTALGRGELIAETKRPFSIEYDPQDSVLVKNMDLRLLQESGPQLWANCLWDQISYSFKNNSWKGHNVTVLIPPEMVRYLGKTDMIPVLRYRNDKLLIRGNELKWENQVEAIFDFHVASSFSISGMIKEGYYWVGEHAWYMKDFTFDFNNDQLATRCKFNFRETPFDIESHVIFEPVLTAQVCVRDGSQSNAEQCLLMKTGWNENEGFYVQSLEGEVYGLDFNFHHHPQSIKMGEMVLSGQLKINVPNVAPLLSTEVEHMTKQVGLGSGYKLSGDIILSKENMRNSYFTGFLKGRDFELMGSHMKTLQSNIYINSFQVVLAEFKISDEAGIFTINEVKFEQFDEGKWNVHIPDINLQDFRPSLLNQIGKYRRRIRPLVIQELNFRNIRGVVGDASSFTGWGELSFTNTFKRNYNILDVPIEIIARLGLDPGIMVPIHGRLEYQIHNGKIHLTELRDSYSEGKRSDFFLSPSYISFIDFDGSIHINIKMKQHVLLKLTEPFTLSIHGNLSQPRFSLK